jgi:hypothetical protein
MSHKLALVLPDEIFDSLADKAAKTGQSAENLAAQLLSVAVVQDIRDPLESFIGAFNSQGSDWIERHDEHLGLSALVNSEPQGGTHGEP